MTALSATSARRRYLILTALRWLPTGLLIPVFVLLPLARGLSLPEVGLVFSFQGLVVVALELPTGGLADSLGRRPVLILASITGLLSLGVLYIADSVPLFIAATVLQGVYRALDSGPLEAWYVDATLAADPHARLDRGLSAGSVALSVGIGAGALLSGGIVALDPFPAIEPLALPVLVAIGLSAVNLVAITALLHEVRAARGLAAVASSVRAVPRTIGEGLALLRSSRVLLGLITVELLWGFGMIAFETLMPVRLAEVVRSSDDAAALMGPVSSAAWAASAVGAAVVTIVSRRVGVAPTAAVLRVLQGLAVAAMGVLAGPLGLIAAFLACYAVHGASNPLHTALLHGQVDARHRTTVLSLNSMAGQPAAAIGSLVLAAIAGASSVATAILVGAVVLAAAAPLYLPAWRSEREGRIAVTAPATSD